MLELGNRRGDFEAHVEDLLLALETDILGPLHHAGDIALGLDVLTDTEVAGALLDEGVLPSRQVSNQNVESAEAQRERHRLSNIPWGPSCCQPWTGGRVREPPSFRTWEAVIEKERHQQMCFLDLYREH